MLEKNVIPTLGKRKAQDIKKRDVVLLLDRIIAIGAPIVAIRVLSIIGKMYNFAIGRDICKINPCVKIIPPGDETQCNRVLNEQEIKNFWFGLDKARMSEVTKLALKLELVTCQSLKFIHA